MSETDLARDGSFEAETFSDRLVTYHSTLVTFCTESLKRGRE
jgi:hypothetical protein